jgi:hypothetical protein
LWESLTNVYRKKSGLFPHVIKSDKDIAEKFSVFRSFQRGSDTQAHEQGISEKDIFIVNHWKRKETANGRKESVPINHTCADVWLLLKPFMRYTQAM